MQSIEHILSSFQPITLMEMDNVQLMNRTDTKFMFSFHQLLEILPVLKDHYRTLEVEGVRQSRYATLYYDTPEFRHYMVHQNGKRHRFKIRKREYVESNLAFLEIKEKNNKGRTAKVRMKLKTFEELLDEKSLNYISLKAADSGKLEPKLWNSFTRTTLVDHQLQERVTLDTNVAYQSGDKVVLLDDFVIAEVKQSGANRHSAFITEMKKRLIRPEGISKYCLGVAMLFPDVKSNTFKEKILKIKKIIHEHDTNAQ